MFMSVCIFNLHSDCAFFRKVARKCIDFQFGKKETKNTQVIFGRGAPKNRVWELFKLIQHHFYGVPQVFVSVQQVFLLVQQVFKDFYRVQQVLGSVGFFGGRRPPPKNENEFSRFLLEKKVPEFFLAAEGRQKKKNQRISAFCE